MKRKGATCPKCGGGEIIADATVIDRGDSGIEGELTVATYGKPWAIVFKEKRQTTLSAWVCASCGFVELYADKPGAIQVPKS